MNEATAWIYFAAALLGFLAAAITSIRAIIRWGSGRGVLRLLVSLAFDALGFVMWIMTAVAGFSGWGPSATWFFGYVFILCSVVGFATSPRMLTRSEIALFCFMLANALMLVATFIVFENAPKNAPPRVPAAISPTAD